MDLQELLGRKVDLVVEGTLRPYAAESANRDKILIYERKSEEYNARYIEAKGYASKDITEITGLTIEKLRVFSPKAYYRAFNSSGHGHYRL